MKTKFDSALKKLNLKVTPRRLAILEVLKSAPVFLSPEEIWKKVGKQISVIGLPTVYRVLEELSDGGLITRVLHANRQLYYYMCLNEGHHHHFICLSCHKVEDVEICMIDQLEEEVSQRIRGKLLSHILQLQGICGECKERNIGA